MCLHCDFILHLFCIILNEKKKFLCFTFGFIYKLMVSNGKSWGKTPQQLNRYVFLMCVKDWH